jgi:hypothetical protein
MDLKVHVEEFTDADIENAWAAAEVLMEQRTRPAGANPHVVQDALQIDRVATLRAFTVLEHLGVLGPYRAPHEHRLVIMTRAGWSAFKSECQAVGQS